MTARDIEVGLKVRKAVLGADYVARAFENTDAFNEEFQNLLTEFCWGRVWARPGLPRRQRSLNVLCMLAALNRSQEFETHVRGALRNGCTKAELRETLLQIAVYCGMPAGVEAFRIARRVLEEKRGAGIGDVKAGATSRANGPSKKRRQRS